MYLIDTNVLSELRKIYSHKGHPQVELWKQTVADDDLYISTITIRELHYGILRIQQRDKIQAEILRTWLEKSVLIGFAKRILPITTEIAWRCAELHIPDPRPELDSWIAATALVHDFTLVTRNIKDFSSTGVRLLNPWEA